VLLLQNGFGLLAWVVVFLIAACFILGLIWYVHNQRKHTPDKKQEGEFRR
jgi:heme/copper-type cytochrome/quinol oxidase subunit 4